MKRQVVKLIPAICVLMLLSLLLPAGLPVRAALSASASQNQESSYADRSDPVRLLASYYDAINRREYQRAYRYWESSPSGASLAQFARGYATTREVVLSVTPPTSFEGAAGSVYAAVPTVLVATHQDGSEHTFAGCYVVRRRAMGDTGWRLYNASISAIASDADAAIVLNVAALACKRS